MECLACRTLNRSGRRFCAQCGAALAVECPGCHYVNEPLERYCGGCGGTLAPEPNSAIRGREARSPERRQLTVLFCDLVGSTALSHRLDPEDLREVIRDYHDSTSRVIARYEGFVARYMGDGVLVYFGYPRAHEDDASRAIATGLEIVETFGARPSMPKAEGGGQLKVRIGIATGLVVVGDMVGNETVEEAAVLGDTPNLAARLQALAKPNTVVVSESTRRLAGGIFEFADQDVHRLKGFRQPVRVWRVIRSSGVETRFDAARGRKLTPFVGREVEIEQLTRCWQRAQAGHGQLALIAGEAGIGKSRIADRFGERVADSPQNRLVYQCSPYHTNSALYPFIHQLERSAGFDPCDTEDKKLDKLEALLGSTASNPSQLAPLFAALLSLSANRRYPELQMTPDQQKAKTLSALLAQLRMLAATAPVLMLFEDAHWIDPTSTELLSLLTDEIQDIPLLAIVTSRSAPDASWLGRQHVTMLPLERLDRQHTALMVDRLLGRKRLPREFVNEIVARTDGVPLFIEELTKAVAISTRTPENKPTAMPHSSVIPSTLQDSLMARLDQLGSAKEVAQMGAVIGREFSRDMLAAISALEPRHLSEALETLTSSAIVFDRGSPPWTTFTFKHALVQDAAYSSLLRGRRQEIHERIAETLERSYLDRVLVEPEVVAYHYTQAGRSLNAAKYWAAASRRSIDRSATLEALGHANEGLKLLEALPSNPERDRLELSLEVVRGAAYRAVRGFASSEAERSFLRARTLCEQLGDMRGLIDVRRGLFSCYYARGALMLAREQAQQVAASGRALNDSSSRMLGHWMLGCITFWQGEFETARRELEEAFSLYDPGEQRAKTLALQIDPGVNALFHLSWTLWILGYPDKAIHTSDRALGAARDLAQPFAVAMGLFFSCTTRACCGEHDSVRPLLEELIALTDQHELRYLGSCAHVLQGQALIAMGQCAAGLAELDRAFSEFRAQEAGVGLPWAMSIAAEGQARLGHPREALATLARAFEAVSRNGEHHWEAELFRLKGEALLALPDANPLEAETSLRRAVVLAQEQSAKSIELRATTSLARSIWRQGKTDLARSMLRDVSGWFTEGFNTADMRDAMLALKG